MKTFIMGHGEHGAMTWERINGMEYDDIAVAFNVTVEYAYTAISRIRVRIRKHDLAKQVED